MGYSLIYFEFEIFFDRFFDRSLNNPYLIHLFTSAEAVRKLLPLLRLELCSHSYD